TRAGAVARDLPPDPPATRRRDADGAQAVARVGEGHRAARHGGGRAAARAARDVIRVPRRAARAEQHRLGRAGDAELGRVRLAEEDDARLPETPGESAVGGRDFILREAAAAGARPAADRAAE